MLTRTRRFFLWRPSLRLRRITLVVVQFYAIAAAVSVVVAHVAIVAQPESGLADRIVAPVARGLEFLDTHWKAVLILVLPFIAPVVQELIPRVRKLGSLELSEVPVERLALGEKREQSPRGGMQ